METGRATAHLQNRMVRNIYIEVFDNMRNIIQL